MNPRYCRYCGAEFVPPTSHHNAQQYCSAVCSYAVERLRDRDRWRSRSGIGPVSTRPTKCRECSAPLPAKRTSNARYCSAACRMRHKRANDQARIRAAAAGLPSNCKFCRQPIDRVFRPTSTYCSAACAQYSRGRLTYAEILEREAAIKTRGPDMPEEPKVYAVGCKSCGAPEAILTAERLCPACHAWTERRKLRPVGVHYAVAWRVQGEEQR